MKLHFESENVKERTVAREKGHGRIETREYFLETEIEWLSQKPDWVGMNAIGKVKSSAWEKESLREETAISLLL